MKYFDLEFLHKYKIINNNFISNDIFNIFSHWEVRIAKNIQTRVITLSSTLYYSTRILPEIIKDEQL